MRGKKKTLNSYLIYISKISAYISRFYICWCQEFFWIQSSFWSWPSNLKGQMKASCGWCHYNLFTFLSPNLFWPCMYFIVYKTIWKLLFFKFSISKDQELSAKCLGNRNRWCMALLYRVCTVPSSSPRSHIWYYWENHLWVFKRMWDCSRKWICYRKPTDKDISVAYYLRFSPRCHI